MAGTNTTDLNGLFKQAYAADIQNLIPDESLLTREIKFQGRDYLLGNQYNQPVIVRSEQGFTYSRPNNGTFSLNPASSMKTQNAIVDGYIILEQSGISYEAVARSDNVNSFRNAVDLVMGDAMESFGRRLEIGLIYGQSATGIGAIATSRAAGIAVTASVTTAGAGYTNGVYSGVTLQTVSGAGSGAVANVTVAAGAVSAVVVVGGGVGYGVGDTFTLPSGVAGTPTTAFVGTIASITAAVPGTSGITFAPGQWAAGLWTPLEGAQVDAYTSAGVSINTAGPLTVSAISVDTKSIFLQGVAGDLTALNSTGAGGYLRFYSAGTNGADEAVGLDKIFTNTGVLFGIDASVYSLWKANTFNVGGALTLAKIQAGVAVAASRGLSEDVSIYVNPTVWQQLSTEQVAYRMLDSSYSNKKVQNGFEALEFFSQNGKLTVLAHKYVKEGDAFLLPPDRAVRIGSSDVSFNIPGTDNGQIFIQNPTTAGFTFRIFSQQNLLVTKPANCTKFFGITP